MGCSSVAENLFKLRDETFPLSFVSPPLLHPSSLRPCFSGESKLRRGKRWRLTSRKGKRRKRLIRQERFWTRIAGRAGRSSGPRAKTSADLSTGNDPIFWGQIMNPAPVTHTGYACVRLAVSKSKTRHPNTHRLHFKAFFFFSFIQMQQVSTFILFFKKWIKKGSIKDRTTFCFLALSSTAQLFSFFFSFFTRLPHTTISVKWI